MLNCSQMPDTFVRGQRISIYKHVFSPGPEDYKHTQLSRFSHIAQHTHTHTPILLLHPSPCSPQFHHSEVSCMYSMPAFLFITDIQIPSIFLSSHWIYFWPSPFILHHSFSWQQNKWEKGSPVLIPLTPPPSFLFSLLSLFLHFASVHIAEALNPCRNFQKQRKKKWFPVTVATMSKSPLFLSGKSQRLEVWFFPAFMCLTVPMQSQCNKFFH